MGRKKPSGATPALTLLDKAGVPYSVHSFDSGQADFGAQAARELQVDPARVFKTLVIDAGFLAVCLVPVDSKLSLKKAARAFGAPKATMADPKRAERSSGYVTGGISPLGQRTVLPTAVDDSALQHETIFFSGGRRGLDIEISPKDLEKLLELSFYPLAQ
ncbi:hypothetical protein CPHO_09495 [Corynebacterium phocae]|uniref:Cys-tRNA(Pro)/Cys-tRNA(Cys) deacylase n=1 Tax=Corynebacterium phocae TaxID=161895 RepID=A0A1L7D4P0_9CORY|nr:Cys-tRNA(Pro) deacylase [Corynebacterium phocae]APT93080.1 hypothetical protein CPHO_09495 [Corynebacterium phocae]KAA8722382.1 Cys-tRNA(Pro) deacylase [Corynebacterium phocae]